MPPTQVMTKPNHHQISTYDGPDPVVVLPGIYSIALRFDLSDIGVAPWVGFNVVVGNISGGRYTM